MSNEERPPKRIYLQRHENSNDDFSWTWAENRIEDDDVAYVLASTEPEAGEGEDRLWCVRCEQDMTDKPILGTCKDGLDHDFSEPSTTEGEPTDKELADWLLLHTEGRRAYPASHPWYRFAADRLLTQPQEQPISVLSAEGIARDFHEVYERLAPTYGYKTRDESAVPWEDVPENNRALMVATVRAVFREPQEQGERVEVQLMGWLSEKYSDLEEKGRERGVEIIPVEEGRDFVATGTATLIIHKPKEDR